MKKDIAKTVHKTVTQDANYHLETKDSRNILSQCCLELCDMPYM